MGNCRDWALRFFRIPVSYIHPTLSGSGRYICSANKQENVRPMNARRLALAIAFCVLMTQAAFATSNVVISQIYGGGGNSGATYKNDFIEIFNRGASSQSLAGWSVQYASSAGSSWQVTNLTGSIAPGQYYLIQEAARAAGSLNLPTPDAIGTIPMSAPPAQVALVSSTTALTCG